MKNCVWIILVLFLTGCTKQKRVEVDSNLDNIARETGKQDSLPLFGIAIHGGAGTILKKNMSAEKEEAYKSMLEKAIRTGHGILKRGGTSLEAVEKTINILENSPLFNAGKGAVFTSEETNELDASIMDGSNLNAGAVSGVTTVKNPINLAKEVMLNSPHVMLSGKGAEDFAKQQGLKLVPPAYFRTDSRLESLKKTKEAENKKDKIAFYDESIQNSKFGTVGCVALDLSGNLAAGTSTGGMTNKKWNRIGDAPIIGAGTYANNKTCAVSSTGWGEYFIRGVVAHDISAMMEYKDITLQEAAQKVIQEKIPALGGSGGIVAIDNKGNVAIEFNTAGMYRATMDNQGELKIGIYK